MDADAKELFDIGLGDTRLEILQWVKNDEDLLLGVRQPKSRSTLMIRLVWVTRFSMSIDFGHYAGSPLIFESRLESLPRDRWALEIEFGTAPEGLLSCECNDIRLDRRPPDFEPEAER